MEVTEQSVKKEVKEEPEESPVELKDDSRLYHVRLTPLLRCLINRLVPDDVLRDKGKLPRHRKASRDRSSGPVCSVQARPSR